MKFLRTYSIANEDHSKYALWHSCMCFVKTEEEAEHIHEMRLQSISFQICQIAEVTHIQNIVVLWYFPSERKIPSMFLVPPLCLLATHNWFHTESWLLKESHTEWLPVTDGASSTSSGIVRLGHTGARALATRGCAPPVQVHMHANYRHW